MVWLHGGAFSGGSSIEQVAYEGENLCKHGQIVFVSINHRLNVLGYCDPVRNSAKSTKTPATQVPVIW